MSAGSRVVQDAAAWAAVAWASMKILFISSVAIITPDPPRSWRLFVDALGLPLEQPPGDEYAFSDKIEGSKHFGVWPLAQAAEACFGSPTWPSDRTVPQVSIEFEVESAAAVGAAADELAARGYVPVHPPRTEPWGQTVARILLPEGVIIGVSYAPSMHATG
jgi:catechol 2,3-dioxygenase-like lactoylglutathione lyase family enzyme